MDKETYEAMRELTEEIVELQAAIHNIYALLETFLWYNVKNVLIIQFLIAAYARKSDGFINFEWKVKRNEYELRRTKALPWYDRSVVPRTCTRDNQF